MIRPRWCLNCAAPGWRRLRAEETAVRRADGRLLELLAHSRHAREKNSSWAACCVRGHCSFASFKADFAANSAAWMRCTVALTSLCSSLSVPLHGLNFAAVWRADWKPKCSRILDGVKSQYMWPQQMHSDLHFLFSFCSILLKNCHRLRGSSGGKTRERRGTSPFPCKARIVLRPHPGSRHYSFFRGTVRYYRLCRAVYGQVP